MSQIIVGMSVEGSTDIRLLESIILRTFESVGDECTKQIEVIGPITGIDKEKATPFVEGMVVCCKGAFTKGVMALCVHVDADAINTDSVLEYKFDPLSQTLESIESTEICKVIVPLIPVRMSEAWMLADTKLLKEEIGTDKTDHELGIHKFPESYADPKAAITEAIRIARAETTQRRRSELKIADLYQSIGSKIQLEKLHLLPSYRAFRENVRKSYIQLNYLQP